MDLHSKEAEQRLNQQIKLEEISLLYDATPFSYSASILISLTIYFVLLGHVSSEHNLQLWLGMILTVLLLRSVDSFLFSRQSINEQRKNKWRMRFFAGTAAAGFCWGLLPWMGYSPEMEYLAFIVVCVVGVISGSLSTLSYRWEAMALFLLPASILLVLRLMVEGEEFSNATSFVLIVFMFFSLSSGKRIFNNTQQNIRLRLEAYNRERAIELMHQKQALHVQKTPLAVIEFDKDMCITEWNHAAEKIFGYSRAEAIGENILRLILPRDSVYDAEKIWEKLLKHETITGDIVENKTKSGTPIVCQWFITPLTDNQNEIVGIAAMALDISEKTQHEKTILKSKEEAEKANQAKSDFLSSMSHELRTPLNAILGFTQLLMYDKTLNDKQQSHLSEINNAGNMLLELVNQILDLARIEKGHLHLSMEQVNIKDIFNECRSMVTPLIEQNNLHLNVESETNGHVVADYTRLKQVMLNLLGNAIKYNTEHGSVSLKVLQKDRNIVRICVIDTGKGISEKQLDEIFQPFNRLNAGVNIEGTGIGLSISKQLIEMMNGKIGVNSKVGEGSEFWIELNGKLDLQTAMEKESKTLSSQLAISGETRQDHLILVAEDNPANQALILSQLEALGYTAVLARNGQEALNMLVHNNYQLLITDCNMPLVDGYKLAKTIRERGNNSMPIIALTADAFPEKKAECLKAGMNDQLTKPVKLETLKIMLEKYLN